MASLDAGHFGTYKALHGGKFGKIAVDFLDFLLKGDGEAQARLFNPSAPNSHASQNWDIKHSGWDQGYVGCETSESC